MGEANAISLAFLQNQPKEAARLLQQYVPEQAAEFIKEVPISSLVPVLHQMASWPAARILSLLPTASVAEVLHKLPASESETLLRLVDEALRNNIIDQLPESLAESMKRKLVFPVSAIGAWMNTSIPFFTVDNNVKDCLDLVRKKQSNLGGVLVVVDYDRKLVGLVEVEKLLISAGDISLSDLVDEDLEALPVRANLGEVENSGGWIKYSTLPVVDHNNILLGVLTHSALMSGIAKSKHAIDQNLRKSLIINLVRAFFVAFGGVANVLWDSSEKPANDSSQSAKFKSG